MSDIKDKKDNEPFLIFQIDDITNGDDSEDEFKRQSAKYHKEYLESILKIREKINIIIKEEEEKLTKSK